MLFNPIPSLHQRHPTLYELGESYPILFQTIVLPHGMDKQDLISFLFDRYGTLETTFDNAQQAESRMRTWNEVQLPNWTRMYRALTAEYEPLENYSMTETMEDDETVTDYGRTHTRTDNTSHAKTGTEQVSGTDSNTRTDNTSHAKTGTEGVAGTTGNTRTDNLTSSSTGGDTLTLDTTETGTPNLTQNTTSSVWGFNSANAVDSTKDVQTNTGTSTTKRTGTETHATTGSTSNTGTVTESGSSSSTTTFNTTETDTGTVTDSGSSSSTTTYNTTDADTGTVTDADTGSDTSTRNYTLTRNGNIGVTTSQQMLESELRLRCNYNMYEIIGVQFCREFLVQVW